MDGEHAIDGSTPSLRLDFDNRYARLGDAFATRVDPTPLREPYAVAWNDDAAALIGIDERPADVAWVAAFSGHAALPGSEPVAMLYAGHQFGAWVPQLGDGRAILLGEARGPGGTWDLHLKGAGPTPYSRGFDGRAVLRSTIREYLCSEAMHGLGIPTTRALCIVGSDEPVRRERIERAATLVRLAPSHVRFGSFEVFASRGAHDELRTLADHVIGEHMPELAGHAQRHVEMLREVVRRTAVMIAHWQAVGWTHGVMNTDNMSILGITIDYGPYGFLDDYNADYTPNLTDQGGRYAFAQQPGIALWNLTRLAEALLPLITHDEAVAALDSFEPAFTAAYESLARAKLGLHEAHDDDIDLLAGAYELMAANRVDHTRFWRLLGAFAGGDDGADAALAALVEDGIGWQAWAQRYRERLQREGGDAAQRMASMHAVNPKYILRNYLAEQAIRRAVDDGDHAELLRLHALLREPFAEQPELEHYAEPPPSWGRGIALSCSS